MRIMPDVRAAMRGNPLYQLVRLAPPEEPVEVPAEAVAYFAPVVVVTEPQLHPEQAPLSDAPTFQPQTGIVYR